jgi:hypothetical protein
VKYASCVKNQAKKIILIHGEPDASTALQEKFKGLGLPPVIYPALYDEVET